MAKKKLTKSQKLKKQNQRVARQRKKQQAPLIAQEKIEDRQQTIEEENKLALEFCELVISKILNDNCLTISKNEDGELNISDGFVDFMYPYFNELEAPTSIKEKAINRVADRLEKIHYDMAMDYLPDPKEIADTAAKRFNSGERSAELREFVRKHCDASEYIEWEDSFWDIAEDQYFTVQDYDALPRGTMIKDTLEIRKQFSTLNN
jgi:hypothetical protein